MTLTVLISAYYVISGILLYSTEIKAFFKGQKESESREDRETHRSDDRDEIMGRTRLSDDETVSRAESFTSEELNFSELQEAEEPFQTDTESLLVGTVSDLLQELKAIAEKISGWNKDEGLPLLREVLRKYPQLIGTQYQDSINLFIMNSCLEQVDWELSPEEVEILWPSKES